MYYSPLRYPGGKKNKLSAFIAKICVGDNNINPMATTVEPYLVELSVMHCFLL